MTRLPLRLVIFDCDGVLIDSEGASNRIVAEAITALGWPMTTEQAYETFVGLRLSDIPRIMAAKLGYRLSPEWVDGLRDKLVQGLADGVEIIPGAHDALAAVTALGIPFRVASNSSHEEMAVKFARTGMADMMTGRAHSARDVLLGKPAPDVFLHAAAAEAVPPEACLVIEDSVPGAQGARAAGMACVGLSPHGDNPLLRATGAVLIRSLAELPPILQRAVSGQPYP